MGAKSKIEWTNATWNPLRGCSRISEGCRFCYAEGIAARFSGPGMAYEGLAHRVGGEARWTGKVVLVEDKLTMPLRWKKPRMIFVNSTSDLFHESVPDEWIDRVFAVMALCPQHTFQVLTKRADRMQAYMTARNGMGNRHAALEMPLPNVWLGVSVEDQATADARIPHLLATPAAKRFVSYEPALGPVDFYYALRGIGPATEVRRGQLDWIIVGGESGRGARPFDLQWARDVIAQCKDAGVACFVKQLGAKVTGPHPNGVNETTLEFRHSKAGDIEEWPADLRVREFPQ